MKKCVLPLVLALLIALCGAALAEEELVSDESGRYLSAAEIAELTRQSREIYDAWGLRVMLRITYDTKGYSRDYNGLRNCANDIFNRAYYGQDGMIFLVRMADRYCVTVTKKKGEEIFSRAILDEVEEDILHHLSDGEYYEAFSAYLKDIDSLLARHAKGESFYGGNASLKTPAQRVVAALPMTGLFSAVITALVMLIVRSRMKTAKKRQSASDYISDSALTRQQDLYLYTTTTRTRIQTSSSGGGGGSGHFGGSSGGGSSSGHHF